MSHFTDLLTGIGTLAAGGAAVYAAGVGVRTYKQSVQANIVQALLDTERSFKEVYTTLADIDDDFTYQTKIRPVLVSVNANVPLKKDDEQAQLRQLDLAIRFFYIFLVQSRLDPGKSGLIAPYRYYFDLITDAKDRPELREYIEKYYSALRLLL